MALTALSRAVLTEEGRFRASTVSFSSVVHFERAASIADERVLSCKEDVVTCMSCDTKYHNRSECEVTVHCNVGECVWCVCIFRTNTPPACTEVTCLNHNMQVCVQLQTQETTNSNFLS